MWKTAIAKRLAVQITNPDRIRETKKFSADDEKQSETRKRWRLREACSTV